MSAAYPAIRIEPCRPGAIGPVARMHGEYYAKHGRGGQRRVFLWTFAGLDAARMLHESRGIRLVDERSDTQWGTPVTEQKFVRER
jgi:hypothetical protein